MYTAAELQQIIAQAREAAQIPLPRHFRPWFEITGGEVRMFLVGDPTTDRLRACFYLDEALRSVGLAYSFNGSYLKAPERFAQVDGIGGDGLHDSDDHFAVVELLDE